MSFSLEMRIAVELSSIRKFVSDQTHDAQHPDRTSQQRLDAPIAQAIRDGERKYTDLDVPILAIFANPHAPANYFPPVSQEKLAALSALDQARKAAQVKAFEKLKSAKVVVLPNANHYVFSSNEQDVEEIENLRTVFG